MLNSPYRTNYTQRIPVKSKMTIALRSLQRKSLKNHQPMPNKSNKSMVSSDERSPHVATIAIYRYSLLFLVIYMVIILINYNKIFLSLLKVQMFRRILSLYLFIFIFRMSILPFVPCLCWHRCLWWHYRAETHSYQRWSKKINANDVAQLPILLKDLKRWQKTQPTEQLQYPRRITAGEDTGTGEVTSDIHVLYHKRGLQVEKCREAKHGVEALQAKAGRADNVQVRGKCHE